jgi:alpha-N-arabinofuranosidase
MMIKIRKLANSLLLVCSILTTVWCQSTITVNVDGATQTIQKELFGVLMERLGRCVTGGIWVGKSSTVPNTNGMRNDIIDGFKECGIGCIQYPGGCAAANYNWSVNKNPSNDLGTDQFMQLCQLVGAEPFIVGKTFAEDAASNLAWVKYINENANHPDWTLKYFKVGNEVWGCGGNQTEASFANNYRPNYEALKNPVNGKKLFITASTGLTGNMTWMEAATKNIGSIVDAFEYHDYVFGDQCCVVPSINFSENQYWNIMYRIEVSQIAARYKQITDIYNKYDPEHRIKIVWDEWGDWLEDLGDGWLQQNTVMDALSAAIHLNFFISHADRVQMAGLAQAINVIHSLFLTESSQGKLVKTPTFYVFKLFNQHHTNNAKWAPITSSKIENVTGGGFTMPVLTAGSTVNELNEVNLSFSNIDLTKSRSITVTLQKNNIQSYVISSANIVTGAAKNSYNDFGKAEDVNIQPLGKSNYSIIGKTLTVNIPKYSVVMLTLKPEGTSNKSAVNDLKNSEKITVNSSVKGVLSITSSFKERTPVKISLYGLSGKKLIKQISKTLETGVAFNCIIEKQNTKNGLYLIKIAGEDINYKKVVKVIM